MTETKQSAEANAAQQPDPERVEAFLKFVGAQVTAGFNCALSAVGDELGLYRELKEGGFQTSAEFADRTGLHERWLREWLRHQTCVGHLEYEDGRFGLSAEAAVVLAEDGNPYFFASGYRAVAATYPAIPKLPDAFRTGLGLAYDDHGPACAHGIERMSAYMQRQELVPKLLPEVSGMVERLQQGASVADVGCGAGTALVAMAEAFPASTFVGYDTSQHARSRAERNIGASGASNARIADPAVEPLPHAPHFDLVTTFDVVHDTTHPAQLLAAIRAALKEDGVWLCSDIRSFPTFEQNLAEHPMASLLYGFSVTVCMSASLSTPDGAGLGTLGFNEEVARAMAAEAGFARFERLEHGNALNSFYAIRP